MMSVSAYFTVRAPGSAWAESAHGVIQAHVKRREKTSPQTIRVRLFVKFIDILLMGSIW
jgi:hypothetical protein